MGQSKGLSCLGNVGIVRELLKHNADPSVCNSESLRVAVIGGHLEVVKELLGDERVDPSANEVFHPTVVTSNTYRTKHFAMLYIMVTLTLP